MNLAVQNRLSKLVQGRKERLVRLQFFRTVLSNMVDSSLMWLFNCKYNILRIKSNKKFRSAVILASF